jgi:hypothetical protein
VGTCTPNQIDRYATNNGNDENDDRQARKDGHQPQGDGGRTQDEKKKICQNERTACQEMEARLEEKKPTSMHMKADVAQQR